ncbi:response regulator [Marinobacter lipolyticus]|uniref:response regulator n=1 Tax=Marinobacter lipolyticus TaxID=209639 RepID=UPI003A929601
MVAPLKILIADDHPLFREAISSIISSDFECCEIMETSDLGCAIEITKKNHDLSLILLNMDIPGMHGLDGLITLRDEAPAAPIVIVSAKESKQIALQAIALGAVGYITKSSPRALMKNAIHQILNGNVYLHLYPDNIRIGKERSGSQGCFGSSPIYPELFNSLTHRQLLVLERMGKGESNKQIAFNLHIAESTVKAHVSAILRKLGVHNRVQAILAASEVEISWYLKR